MRSTSFIKRVGILNDIRHLIFPQKCLSCEGELTRAENSICSICTMNFTETNFHLSDEPTSMDKIFWGRISLEKTFALFFFEKAKTTQKVLFQLKYKNNPAKLVSQIYANSCNELNRKYFNFILNNRKTCNKF